MLTNGFVHWPGGRSCRRGWHISAKFSCPHGGWWPAIEPSGSSASLRQYADNPGGKHRKRACYSFVTCTYSLNSREWKHLRERYAQHPGGYYYYQMSRFAHIRAPVHMTAKRCTQMSNNILLKTISWLLKVPVQAFRNLTARSKLPIVAL